MKQRSYITPRPVLKDHPRCLGITITRSPKPDMLRSTLNDLLDSSILHNRAISTTSIREEHRGWNVFFDESAQSPVRDRVADIDTALHPDATLELLGHSQARGIVALSLKRNTTRRDAAQAVANSQRPELHGTPEAFFVEAGTSPRNEQTANSSTRGVVLLQIGLG